jgi:sugar O-acyltransferase (sialic acid O-acetyltransferase NeuD family)
MKDIAIFAAGGFGHEIACIIKQINQVEETWNFIGFFDDDEKLQGTSNEYGKILGGMDVLNAWDKPLAVSIGICNPNVLKIVTEKITNPNVVFPNLIAPNVMFMDYENVRMGKGNVICPNSVVSCNVELGDFNLLNVFTQIGHDSKLSNYNVVMPSVNISGGITIGDCNLFGVKSTILQYKKIGNNVVITPGSVMMRNGKDEKTYMGNPAKVIML